jgi:asparagine synthase (glutamine-hydrolysing)
MCGIAGIIDSNKTLTTKSSIDNFAQFNRFRGPDAYGIETGNLNENVNFAIAHHRLSIVDLNKSANQPMNKGVWKLVFNGEIYNFREIKTELENLGRQFSTNSDTEVILELLEIYPFKEALEKLNGMFALAAINTLSNELFLARDRWGKKPLYYHSDNNHLSFSSDFRSFSTLNKKFTINESGLKYYFSELSLPQPETIFNQINQLLPGHYIVYKNGNLSQKKYLDLFKNKRDNTASQAELSAPSKTVKNLLSNAIKSRLQADVPVGAFLSGGIDSGIIVGLSKKYTEKLNTFTFGFDDAKFDERPYAKILAKKYNTNHHELLINSDDIDIEGLILEFGEPFADSSMIPSYLISKTVSNDQKVVLSGDGGDEIFCGNNTYIQAYKFDNLKKKLNRLKPFTPLLNRLSNKKIKKLVSLQNNPLFFSGRELYRNLGFKENEVNELFNKNNTFSIQDVFETAIKESNYLPNEIFKNIYNGGIRTRLLNDYLVKIDKTSMYASLEIRSPFLDDNLFNFVKQLNKSVLMPNQRLKSILKDLAVDILPEEILNKPKTGFAIPIDSWLIGKWKSLFEEVVLIEKQHFVDLNYSFINKIWQRQLIGESHGHKLFAILVFHIWVKNFSRT